MPIRQATRHDLAALTELNGIVQQLHHDAHPERFKAPGDGIVDVVRSHLDDADDHIFVAEQGSVIAGYVLACVRTKPDSAFTYARRWLDLDQICVRDAHRREGLGRQLVERVLELGDELGLEVELGVWSFNTRARTAFGALGFRPLTGRMVHRG